MIVIRERSSVYIINEIKNYNHFRIEEIRGYVNVSVSPGTPLILINNECYLIGVKQLIQI